MTCNTVTVDADAVLFWRVTGPQRAALEVEKHADAVAMAAQTALRDVIGLRLRSSTTEQKMHFARRANRLGAEDQKMRSIVWRIYSPATDMTDEEVWRAIRYLDPDRRRNAWDMASAIAIVVACVVWYWLIFAAS